MNRSTLMIIVVVIALAICGCCVLVGGALSLRALKNSGPIALPGTQCEVSSCHGLDYSCGKAPQACDLSYQLGDRCLQHATCGVVNNRCQKTDNPAFNACRSCVQQCQTKHPNDPVALFDCESSCP